MVDAQILQAMSWHCQNNLEMYAKEHPGQWALLEHDGNRIKETFCRTKKELDEATKKYAGIYGHTIYTKKIPARTHRFGINNRIFEFVDEYVSACPNDKETRLISRGVVTMSHVGFRTTYEEQAYCPDCNYTVFRRPSRETIRRINRSIKRMIFGSGAAEANDSEGDKKLKKYDISIEDLVE